jgi:AraC-like DNA-binding protein
MNIELTLSNGSPLELGPGLPPDYTGPILRGAVALSAASEDGHFVIQELAGELYSIRLTVGNFFKTIKASGKIITRGLYSYFMLRHGVRKEIASIGKFHLRQDQYISFFTDPTSCSARFEKNKEFRALDIFYSPKLLEELIPYFPEIKEILLVSPGVMLPGNVFRTLPSMQEITSHLLDSPYDDATRQFYFDLKVRELLYQTLVNSYKRNPSDRIYTPWEIAKIHDLPVILETYISKKPPTLKTLAKLVALNEFKLKNGFKQYFGVTIFDWLMEQKMQYAKDLILTTNKPIKDICVTVGYPRTSNFITAFKRRFNMTPGSLRRK